MSSLWPWVAVAGAGALHGLNPTTGWLLAAGCGLRTGDRHLALRALVPIAAGHAASVAVVATAVALGVAMADWSRPVMGAAVLVFVLALCFRWPGRRSNQLGKTPSLLATSGRIGMALWSFIASTAHGSGMMLVPALVPLCLSDSPAREITASGSLLLALTAVAVHALAMLGTLGLVAAGTVGGFAALRRWACAHARGRGSTRTSPARSARWPAVNTSTRGVTGSLDRAPAVGLMPSPGAASRAGASPARSRAPAPAVWLR